MGVEGIRPVGRRHQPLRETVADEIRGAILAGRLAPGDRLVEDRLADELGVSRNPVREALRMLQSEGYVEIVPRRGASVAQLTAEEGHDLLEVRGPLEALAARLAARRITADGIEALRDVHRRGTAAAAQGQLDDLPPLNTEFHAGIVAAAGNVYLADFIRSLRDKIQWVYAADVKARAAESWKEHGELLEAIAQGDEDYAADLASAHIFHAQRAFTGVDRADGAA